jgi:hypothetical protein
VVAGEALDADGLGVRQPHGRDSGRAGQAGGDGQWRVAGVDLQVSGVWLACRRRGGGGPRLIGDCGEGDGAGQGGADGGGPDLGERGQGCVPALGGEGSGLGLIPAERVLSAAERGFSRPLLIPVKKKSSLAFRVHPGRY